MALSYAFGGNTGLSYEDLQRRRMFAEGLMQRGMSSQPKTAMEGLNSAASSIMGALLAKKLSGEEAKGREAASSVFRDLIAGRAGGMGGYGGAPATPTEPNPNAPQNIADDTMRALGKDQGSVIRAGLIQRGLPEHVADAFVMNFKDESGLNPSVNEVSPTVPGSRGGFGLAQWTGPRRVALENFAESRGKPAGDMNTQLDFLMTELQGPEANAAKSIFAAPDAGTAAAAVAKDFLRPAKEHLDRRIAQYTGGVSPMDLPALAAFAANPYADPGQKAVAQALLNQQMQSFDPSYQMGLEKQRLELDAMRNLKPGFRMTTPEEAQAYGGPGQIGPDNRYYPAGGKNGGKPAAFEALKLRATAAGLQEGTPKYEQFMLTGGIGESRPAAFEALRQQALAAGLQEDSPDYQKFMLTKGAGDAAAAKAVGEQQGAATAAAPAEIAAADETLGYITEVRSHVGLDRGTGMSSIFNAIPGTKGYDFKNRVSQLASGAFLTAIDQLRGMGSLSNAEGQTATSAVTRLDTATSKEEFLAALADYERIVKMGRDRAQARLAGGGSTYTYNPATGELE